MTGALRLGEDSEIGLGFEVGLSIVLMAVVLDRSTQAIGRRFQPPTART